MIINYFLFTLILAYVHARLEIEIEGKNGWAKKLPTWKSSKNLFTMVFDKPLTGYHLWTNFFVFAVFHFPLLFIRWGIQKEFIVVGFFVLYWVIEDFLWFVCNPYFGYSRLNKEHATWHKNWLYGFPRDYFWGIGAFLLLLFLGSL